MPLKIESPNPENAPSRLGIADAVGIICLVCALMVVSYLRSRHCMFWGDEIMGYEVLTQPTFAKLLLLWRHGIDSGGIWFYVLARPWIGLFGATEVSLRMFSAATICGSVTVLWLAARRRYELLPVAASIITVYALMQPLRWQLANGRTYGLVMLAFALVNYLHLRGEDDDQTKPTPLFLLATFGAYSVLVGSHTLGLLYLCAMLGTQLALDLSRRRMRWSLYLAAVLSVWVVFISRANLLATAAIARPSFWTPKPTFRGLLVTQGLLGRQLTYAVLFLFVLALPFLRKRASRRAIYVILACFVALDLAMYFVSLYTTSIYSTRYLLPLAVAVIYIACELFTLVREADFRWSRLRVWLPAVYIFGALISLFVHRFEPRLLPTPDYTGDLVALLPAGYPIIDPDVETFVSLEFYQHQKVGGRIKFPTDWQVAMDPAREGGVSGFHEMDNWHDMGLYTDDIVPTADALAGKKDFLVVVSPSSLIWVQRRILANPQYEVEPFATFSSEAISKYAFLQDLKVVRVHAR